MGQVINTNTLSLVTQNNLSKSQMALNTSIQRLSSGMRINSAKDDSAGQAIANRFTASIRGLTQAQRNANDGISLAQTTEGALNEVNNNLQRIRELTVQAANGSNSQNDKVSIQAEIQQRLDEIDRTSAQTDFNGVKVMAAGAGSLSVQVGAQDNETINIGLTAINTSALGLTGFNVDAATVAGTGTAAVGTAAVGTAAAGTAAAGTAAVGTAAAGTAATGTAATGTAASSDYAAGTIDLTASGLAAQAGLTGDGTFDVVTDGTAYFVTVAGNTDIADGNYELTLDPADGTFTLGAVDGATDISAFTAVSQGDAFVVGTAASSDYAAASSDYAAASSDYAVASSDYAAASSDYAAASSDYAAASSDYAAASSDYVAASSDYVAGTGTTASPLAALDAALKIVDTNRSMLGAVQNRFDSIISNLGTTINNLTSSRSRIEDADYAVEVSNMTRAQILQQAGTSVLAKANQSTQGVMALLQ